MGISVVGMLPVEWSLFVMSVESSLMVEWSVVLGVESLVMWGIVVFAVESLEMWGFKVMWCLVVITVESFEMSIMVLVVEGTHAVKWVVMDTVISCIMRPKIVGGVPVSSPVCSIMATEAVVKAVIIAITFMSIAEVVSSLLANNINIDIEHCLSALLDDINVNIGFGSPSSSIVGVASG